MSKLTENDVAGDFHYGLHEHPFTYGDVTYVSKNDDNILHWATFTITAVHDDGTEQRFKVTVEQD